MNSKVKFLWIYTGILFSFALILIIFAYLTQNNISKENEVINKNMSGYKASIENLTKENEKLKAELDKLNTELAEEKDINSNNNSYFTSNEKRKKYVLYLRGVAQFG